MKPVCPAAHRCACTFSKNTIYPVPYQRLSAIFLFLRSQVTKPLPIETHVFVKGLAAGFNYYSLPPVVVDIRHALGRPLCAAVHVRAAKCEWWGGDSYLCLCP